MLSLRHSIGNTSPVESLARNSTSISHFRCYASPPPTETCARDRLLKEINEKEDSLRFYFLDVDVVTEHHGTKKPIDLEAPLIL